MPAKINANLSRILQKCLLLALLSFIWSSFSFAQNSTDSLLQRKDIIQDSLMKMGYWEAQVRIEEQNSLNISKGRPYYWETILVYEDNLPTFIPFLSNLKGTIANQFLLNRKLNSYINTNYHRSGYPLAKASLSIDNLNDNGIEISIRIVPQNFILYDSVRFRGDSQSVNTPYLSNLLNLNYNQEFDIKSYHRISDRIEQLEFISLASDPELKFANNKAIVELDIKKERSNQFDAIIGLVPDGSRTNLTGQVNARLRNLFKRGVGLDVFWQKYSANSQLLSTRLQQSHAFRSPLGIHFGFELLQEDSTFLQTSLQVGSSYPLANSFQVGLSYQRGTNNVLRDFSESEVANLNPLRSSIVNALVMGTSWKTPLTYPQLKDYSFAELDLSAGIRQIMNFAALPAAWQDVPQNSTNLTGRLLLHWQKVLGKRFLLEAIPQYSVVQNQALSQNDLLRLGGLQNLRGFDRNFFYTRYYGLLNLNYRYFLDQKSSFFLLTDVSKLQSNIGWLYAAGAGLDVKSKNGWFRIIYALGQEVGKMPDFSQGKVHFGYIAVF
ncbi:BamA/TamA family outer membrane protein [Marivirga sericea]|nr:hypothetical protein [Marivirga sericea]